MRDVATSLVAKVQLLFPHGPSKLTGASESAEKGVPWVLRAAATVRGDLKVCQRGRASQVGLLSKKLDVLEGLRCCSPELVGEGCR